MPPKTLKSKRTTPQPPCRRCGEESTEDCPLCSRAMCEDCLDEHGGCYRSM